MSGGRAGRIEGAKGKEERKKEVGGSPGPSFFVNRGGVSGWWWEEDA